MKALDCLLLGILVALAVILLQALGGCATQTYPRGPLVEQELWFFPGHAKGPVNQICLEYKGEICQRAELIEYDLFDEETRRRLIEARFFCKVGQRIMGICADKAGLCFQETVITRRVIGIPVKREIVVTEVIELPAGLQRLVDVRAICGAQGSATFGSF